MFDLLPRFRLSHHVLMKILVVGLVVQAFSPVFSEEPLINIKLRLKWKHQFQFAGYYMAKEKGFYKDAGLNVEISEPVGNKNSIQAVVDGDADFGISMSDLILSRAKGIPLVALAPIFQHSPLIILTTKSSGINSVHGLAGKTISLEAHSEELLAYLSSEGLSINRLTLVPHAYDPYQLLEGKIDAMSAYSTDEPFIILKEGFQTVTLSPRSGGIDFYGDTLFTSEQMVTDNPERVKAFLNASLKGWKYALSHIDETIDLIYITYSNRHSLEHLKFESEKTLSLIMPDVVEVGYNNPGRWEAIADTYKKMKMIPDNFSLDSFIYNREIPVDLYRFYLIIGCTLLLALVASLVSFRFYILNQKLKQSINEIKVLREVLPICAFCKKIRSDEGYWNQLEEYLKDYADIIFSHGVCPECAKKHYGVTLGKDKKS